jgi:hypothetical protein
MISDTILLNSYYNWISSLAISDELTRRKYSMLLQNLYDTPFTYILDLDKNRAIDGVELRYRFGSLFSYNVSEINSMSSDRQCSVLEMMVALALRIEEQIMKNQIDENNTSTWFIEMLKNLKLLDMMNDQFDSSYFERCINTFMDRDYSPNGYGGLFTVESPRQDMRNTEIWYQCMWHLEELIRKEN